MEIVYAFRLDVIYIMNTRTYLSCAFTPTLFIPTDLLPSLTTTSSGNRSTLRPFATRIQHTTPTVRTEVFQTNPLSITASVQHINTVLRHEELT